MSYDKMDSSAVYAMFEEIKEDLNKRPVQQSTPAQTTTEPAIRREDMAEMQEMTATLKEVVEAVRLPQKHIHKHTIDLMSNKVLIILAAVMVALVVSLWVVRNQRDTIKQFRDNDLKYRYIQMRGQAVPEDILMLRDVFDYNRNADSIKIIRQRVERYEQLIKQQAESEARARLNAEEAERLQNQVETVKGRK